MDSSTPTTTGPADLLILQAGRRLAEVPPPIVATADELGRDAGTTAASWVFDGNTPEDAYQRVLRGIDDGDPAVLDEIEPPAIGPGAGYGQADLTRDLGIQPARPRPAPGRGSPMRTPSPAASGRKLSGPPASTLARTRAWPSRK